MIFEAVKRGFLQMLQDELEYVIRNVLVDAAVYTTSCKVHQSLMLRTCKGHFCRQDLAAHSRRQPENELLGGIKATMPDAVLQLFSEALRIAFVGIDSGSHTRLRQLHNAGPRITLRLHLDPRPCRVVCENLTNTPASATIDRSWDPGIAPDGEVGESQHTLLLSHGAFAASVHAHSHTARVVVSKETDLR